MSALAPVNAAQIDYVRQELPRRAPGTSQHAGRRPRPRRSAPASAARTITPMCMPGPLTLRSAADLYFYPNTLTRGEDRRRMA